MLVFAYFQPHFGISMHVAEIKRELRKKADRSKAAFLPRFFKTGPGEYGEGDRFLGVTVPNTRLVAKRYAAASPDVVDTLLHSGFHEDRLCALLILVHQYARAETFEDEREKERIYGFYMAHRRQVNNWDLVDLSAPRIVGAWLHDKGKEELWALAESASLWERRIAIVSTLYFIQRREFSVTLRIARSLFRDKEDLLHKATGWMLREVGKKDEPVLAAFLRDHYHQIPRTTLRYAIERFPEKKRKSYLNGEWGEHEPG